MWFRLLCPPVMARQLSIDSVLIVDNGREWGEEDAVLSLPCAVGLLEYNACPRPRVSRQSIKQADGKIRRPCTRTLRPLCDARSSARPIRVIPSLIIVLLLRIWYATRHLTDNVQRGCQQQNVMKKDRKRNSSKYLLSSFVQPGLLRR